MFVPGKKESFHFEELSIFWPSYLDLLPISAKAQIFEIECFQGEAFFFVLTGHKTDVVSIFLIFFRLLQ